MSTSTFFLLLAVLCAAHLPQSSAVTTDCTDVQPGDFPCPMEKNWGKCDEGWMLSSNYCAFTCGRCEVTDEQGEIEDKAVIEDEDEVEDEAVIEDEDEVEDEDAVEEDEDEIETVSSEAVDTDEEVKKTVEKEAPVPATDGDIIRVGDSNFEIEAPKTIESSGTDTFKGFKTDCETVLGTLKNVPDASIAYELLNGLKEDDEELHDELEDDDTQYTLFIPLNSAFEEFLDKEDIDDPEAKKKVLLEHISPVIYHTGMMQEGEDYETLGKYPISVETLAPSEITLTKGTAAAEIVLSNIWACKSMIHLVDRVLST